MKANQTQIQKNKTMKSFVSLKHRITGYVTAVIMLLQICLPAAAAAASLVSNESVSAAMAKPQFQLSNDNSYLYKQASYDDSQYISSKNITSFHDELLAAKINVGAPTFVPIAGDITIFIPTYPVGKLLGDNYVQSRYIRQQINDQLGRHLIDAANEDEITQINRLYNNAKIFAINKNSTYKYGDNLPATEAITLDMIWPERRTINGQQVMVPIVYLKLDTIKNFSVTNHTIEFLGNKASFKSISLDHTNLTAGRNTLIDTVRDLKIINSSITSAGGMKLTVGGTLSNLSSSITANGNLDIVAGQFVSKTLLVPFTDRFGGGTRLGRVASVSGTDVTIETKGGDIAFEGSTAIATNGKLVLNSKNNISILPVFLQTQQAYNDGTWDINSTAVNVVGSRLSSVETMSLIAGGSISITASELISTQGGIELLATNGIYVLDELGNTLVQKSDTVGKTRGAGSDFKSWAIRSVLDAGKGVLLKADSGDIKLRAAKITSKEGTQVTAKNGKVHLLVTKEQSQHYLNTVRKGFWTIKTVNEQYVEEKGIPNAIVGGFAVQALNGIDVEYTGIDIKTNPDLTLRIQIDEYRKMPDMKWMADLYDDKDGKYKTQVNWKEVELAYKHIREHNTSLSPAAMAIVAIACAVAMGPAGTGWIGSGGGGAIGSLVGEGAMGAALNAGALTLATSAVQNIAAGNSLSDTLENITNDEGLKALAISMATAGAMQAIPQDSLNFFKEVNPDAVSAASLGNQAIHAIVNATVTAGIAVTIDGGDSEAYRKAFNHSLAANVVNELGDTLVKKIGGLASGDAPQISEAMKYVTLAGSGCIIGLASAAATDSPTSDKTVCYSAAGGAVIGEYVGELYSQQQQEKQQELLQKFLSDHGVNSLNDISNLTQQQYGQLLLDQPKVTKPQIEELRAAGIDLSKFSAALVAFAVGGDVNIASESGDRTARNSALLRFQNAMESANSLNQYMRLEDFTTLLNELKLLGADKDKIENQIKIFIASGKFDFLKGLTTTDAIDAIIKYLDVNGNSFELLEGFKKIRKLFPNPVGTLRLSGDVSNTIEEERLAVLADFKRNLDAAVMDHSIRVESEALYNLMMSSGFDPSKTPVAELEKLINALPPERAKTARFALGISLGITDYLVSTGSSTADALKTVALSPIEYMDFILYDATGNESFKPGGDKFMQTIEFVSIAVNNLDKIGPEIRKSFTDAMDRAKSSGIQGDYIEEGKIYASGALTLLTAIYGLTRVATATANKLKNLSKNLGQDKAALDEAAKFMNGEEDFYNSDLIPDHIITSRLQLKAFISEHNIPLQEGWDVDRLYDEVLSIPKPNRPKPEDYLPREYIEARLAEFNSGVVRITGREGFKKYGTLFKGDEGFCLPRTEFDRLMSETGGDLKAMGERLNLGRDLDPNKDMVAFIERKNVTTLKAPSGNEAPHDLESGANREWTPGLKTKNGVTEAVMSFPPGTDLTKIVIELKLL